MGEMAAGTENDAEVVKRLIAEMPENEKRGLKGWYFFDWANQAYALTVMTVIAPQLMASLYNLATGSQSGDTFYAYVLTFSMIFVVLTAPALGVIADKMPVKKKLLKWYTVAGVLFTALMGAAPYFGSQGYIVLAMMYTIGTIGFTGGNVIYYSFMPYLADKRCMDHVSSRGYAYGFAGGSMILVFHLVVLMGPFDWDTNFKLAVIFVTSAIWWWGFGLSMFKWTDEPEIPSHMEWEGFVHASKVAYGQVLQTAKEIKRFKVLALFLIAYLLFYDGVNTIASMASAFGESVLRIDTSMNVMLLLTVNIVAIPMTLVFGKLADIKGTKFALMLALLIYCLVAVTAAGFAPLELEGEADKERYDFQFEWNEETQVYEMTTLYNRGYDGWVSENSEGDAAFRDAFQDHFPEMEEEEATTSASTLGQGLLVCVFILVMLGILGFGVKFLMDREMGIGGIAVAVLMVLVGIYGASFLAGQKAVSETEVQSISEADAVALAAAFDETDAHRFSIIIVGGSAGGASEVGAQHPSVVEQGGPADGWASAMRDNVWAPLGLGVSLQWIILGMFVGIAMGSAGAQARSMFAMLIPETRTSEFFGFFGFLGKSAAMIGTFLYGIASSAFDSRVAILTITIVILAGTYLTSRVDLEEGMRVAAEEDARARGEITAE